MMFEKMQKEYFRLEEEANKIRRRLQGMPDGKLVCCSQAGGYQKWYQTKFELFCIWSAIFFCIDTMEANVAPTNLPKQPMGVNH